MGFLVHLLVTAVLLLIVSSLVRGIEVKNFASAGIAALVLGLVNAFVKPVLVVLTLPLTLVTLGLFLLVLNAAMIALVGMIVPGFKVRSFGSAFFAAILLAVFNMIVNGMMT